VVTAADPSVARVLDRFHAAAADLRTVGLVPVDADDADAVIRSLEVGTRIARAAQTDLVNEIEKRGLHHVGGHRSAKVMIRHTAHLSDAEALRRAKGARVMRDLPAVASAFRAGRIGCCQVDRIARTHANPRIRHLLVEVEGHVAVLAARLPYREFDRHLTNGERLADEDGAGDDAERHERNRDVRIGTNLDGSIWIDGNLGSLDGAVLRDVHEHFIDAELAADWGEARERLGDVATYDDLQRTEAQRRADALMAIVRAAASHQANQTGGSVIVTNVVIDLATFERHLRRVCSDEPVTDPDPRVATMFDDVIADLDAPPDEDPDPASVGAPAGEPADVEPTESSEPTKGVEPVAEREPKAPRSPKDGAGFRCDTLDGTPIDPAAATANALVNHVRRVVVGADGVVVDVGRKGRLFTGARRLAVLIGETTCSWPGCNVPVTRCQADHLDGFHSRKRGPTNPRNGGPACGFHNRLKEHGFTVHRDERGHWHLYRPDGTEVT